jgi:hypothetical protein
LIPSFLITKLKQQKMTTPADLQKQAKSDMLACVWLGKENVQMKTVPKPEITDDEDVILRITGSTGKV